MSDRIQELVFAVANLAETEQNNRRLLRQLHQELDMVANGRFASLFEQCTYDPDKSTLSVKAVGRRLIQVNTASGADGYTIQVNNSLSSDAAQDFPTMWNRLREMLAADLYRAGRAKARSQDNAEAGA